MSDHTADLEVSVSAGGSKAIVEGKTTVPFKTFVGLVLQRKVTSLFEEWGKSPVIVDSDMLTQLASAPQDSSENTNQLVLVTLGTGILGGIFGFSLLQLLLSAANITIDQRGHGYIAASFIVLTVLVYVLARIKKLNRTNQIVETMEKVASLLKK